MKGESHVTDIKVAIFFPSKTHHIIYQSNRLESANKILYRDIEVIFSRLEDIKQNVWSRDLFLTSLINYSLRNGTILNVNK